MATIKINSAYSAQPSIARPNPFLRIAINYILESRLFDEDPNKLRIADQGCGKLRNLTTLCQYFDTIYLIDTEFQLNRLQRLFGLDGISIKEYVDSLRMDRKKFTVLSNLNFDLLDLKLDLVFNVCVFDVEVPETRKAMATAAYKNLKNGGLYVVIIPRNDQSILFRCTMKNKYLDGHVFRHHKAVTFYKNYSDSKPLIQGLTKLGFIVEADLSVYRQICLILKKVI